MTNEQTRELERLLTSAADASRDAATRAALLGRVLRHMRRPLDEAALLSLATTMAAEHAVPARRLSFAGPRVWARRAAVAVAASAMWMKTLGVAVAVTATTVGVGATGALPDPIQDAVSRAGDAVGLAIPDAAEVDDRATTAAPTTAPSPSDAPPPSDRPPSSTESPPPSTGQSSNAPSSTSTSTTVGSTPAPPARATRTFNVGSAGTVTISHNNRTLELIDITTNTGWIYEIETEKPDQIDIKFIHPDGDATFQAQLDNGNLQIDIDPGDVDTGNGQQGRATRNFDVGSAGTVTISHNNRTLELIEITTNTGWIYEIETEKPDQIDIKFIHPDGDATFQAQLDNGKLQIDIDPG